jgi:hypothetical protein
LIRTEFRKWNRRGVHELRAIFVMEAGIAPGEFLRQHRVITCRSAPRSNPRIPKDSWKTACISRISIEYKRAAIKNKPHIYSHYMRQENASAQNNALTPSIDLIIIRRIEPKIFLAECVEVGATEDPI